MKQAILTILTRITVAMKAESRVFHVSFLPIIQSAIEPGSEIQVYLLEEAMELWESILSNTPSAPEETPAELLKLMHFLPPLYAMENETLRRAIEITHSYLLLSPSSVLADDFRTQLVSALASLIGNLRPDANGTITRLVESVVRGAEGVGGERAVEIVIGDLVNTGFIRKLMDGLHGAWTHHQSHGPSRELPSRAVDGVVETDYFTVLARIGIASPSLLVALVQNCGDGFGQGWLLEEWFGHIDNIGTLPEKKLMALALTRLLETNADWILGRLQDLMVMWTQVLGELLEGMDDKSTEYVFPSTQCTHFRPA